MNKKILFIDDEEITLKIGCMMLKSLGYSVTDVQSGHEALKLLKIEDFDLVLLDLMMPEIYGLDVLRQIKKDKELKNLPVIIQTGIANADEIKNAYALGAVAVINKPYNKDDLNKAFKNVFCPT
jgi:CheY-like chemotaxis protein